MSMNELDCKVQELRELNAMIAELTAEADSLKDLIKQKMVDEGTEVLKGVGWSSTWKSVTSLVLE